MHRIISALGSKISDPLVPQRLSRRIDTTWPASDAAGGDGLAQTGPYDQVFHLPFKTIVMTTLTFANADRVRGIAQSQDRLNAEENEFYHLTKYLHSRFSGSGKTFALKNWETDGFAAFLGSTTADIPQNVMDDLIAWLSARPRGVTRARNEVHGAASAAIKVTRKRSDFTPLKPSNRLRLTS
jgi:hypothetical protein